MKNTIGNIIGKNTKSTLNQNLIGAELRQVVRVIKKGQTPAIGQIIARPMMDAEVIKKAKADANQLQAIKNHEAKVAEKAAKANARAAAKKARQEAEAARREARANRPAAIRLSYIKDGEVRSKDYPRRGFSEANHDFDVISKAGFPLQMRHVGAPGCGTTIAKVANMKLDNIKLMISFSKAADEDADHISSDMIKVKRLVINPEYHIFGKKDSEKFWLIDEIQKKESRLEFLARSLTDEKDPLIRVESQIPELKASPWDIAAIERGEEKAAKWRLAVYNGLKAQGGKLYVPLGHSTNGAKDCKTIWCLAELEPQLRAILEKGISKEWKTTTAKAIAYTVGLQAVAVEYSRLPIGPSNCYFAKEVVKEMEDNVAFAYDNGHIRFGRKVVAQNMGDGQLLFHVSDKMREEMYVAAAAKWNMSVEEARIVIDNDIDNMYASFSGRVKGAAMKFGALSAFDFHTFLKDRGVTKTADGRDIDDIIMLGDTTVLKTNIGGTGKAFASREDWEKTVEEEFTLGILIKEHEDALKDISYQVLSTACMASKATVAKAADHNIEIVKNLTTCEGAARMLGKPQQAIAAKHPELLNVPFVREQAEKRYHKIVDTALGGRIMKQAHYAFGFMDPVYLLTKWFGLPEEYMLNAGEVLCMTSGKNGERVAMWRSPVMDPGALLTPTMISKIPAKYSKYFVKETNAIFFDAQDLMVTRTRGDFDGDHWMWSDAEWVINAFDETHAAIGNYLIDWEAVEAKKAVLTDAGRKDYFCNLVNTSELGSNCTNLSRLYGMTFDEEWFADHPYVKRPDNLLEVLYAALAGYDHCANVNVDSGKHGGKTITILPEYSFVKGMVLPSSINYRHAADAYGQDRETDQAKEDLRAIANGCFCGSDGTLWEYSRDVVSAIDMDLHLVDEVEGKFDYRNIMWNRDCSFRGLNGLVRKGVWSKDLGKTLGRGLFNEIAERSMNDWKVIHEVGKADDRPVMTYAEYTKLVRARALEEIADYAICFGSTLADAYDVITWQMFEYVDKNNSNDPSEVYHRDNLWNTYWMVFGDMILDVLQARGELDDMFGEATTTNTEVTAEEFDDEFFCDYDDDGFSVC